MTTPLLDGPTPFRRPKPQDAVDVAIHFFERGERVDLNTVADRLAIGRSTLYRWVGDREQLLDAALAKLAAQRWREASATAQGQGVDHLLDAARRFMTATAQFEALRAFATREPALALRVLLNPDGRVPAGMRESLKRQLSIDVPDHHVGDDVFRLLAVTATALVWANVAAGQDPQVETAVDVMGAVLRAHIPPSHAPAPRSPV